MKYKNRFLFFLFLLFNQTLCAQQDGYWDKTRATIEEITVSARDRIVIKTQDLPQGTTEIVFRITLLDKNQQMAGSLISVLKSIPDPTGISQGSAGAVFLLSKISGNDTCKYAVFTNSTAAAQYQESGDTTNACFVQDKAVSKDVKQLSTDKSSCMQGSKGNLWFGFESKNWIMNQKIILEVVPWVNKKLSRGWTVENKKSIIDQCKTSNLAQKMSNSDDFCVCILDKIQTKYTFDEFQKLLAVERAKAFKDFGTSCFGESNLSIAVYQDLRKQAAGFAKQGKHGEAIQKLTTIINDGKALALDFNHLGFSYLVTKQYSKAIKFLKEGQKLDETELLLQLNLAHAYLLNDNFSLAKSIYKQYQSQNVSDNLSWKQKIKQDFDVFKKAGITSHDFDKVLRIIE